MIKQILLTLLIVLMMSGSASAHPWFGDGTGGDVSASANITDNSIVRGADGAKGVQGSGNTIDDSDNMTIEGKLTVDVTDTECGLFRKDADGGDVLTVDCTNERVTVAGTIGELRIQDNDTAGSVFVSKISLRDSNGVERGMFGSVGVPGEIDIGNLQTGPILMKSDDREVGRFESAGVGDLGYFMVEGNTPTAQSGYGAIYTKSDNQFYFQDGAGTEKLTGTYSTSVTLTAAQVNALRVTPIELVPAQGVNTLIEFVSAVISYNYTTTAFTVAADEDFVIQYDASTDVSASIESAGFIDQINDEMRWVLPTWTALTDLLSLVNKKLEIFNTGAGETADGGTSTIIINITYRVHATGL